MGECTATNGEANCSNMNVFRQIQKVDFKKLHLVTIKKILIDN